MFKRTIILTFFLSFIKMNLCSALTHVSPGYALLKGTIVRTDQNGVDRFIINPGTRSMTIFDLMNPPSELHRLSSGLNIEVCLNIVTLSTLSSNIKANVESFRILEPIEQVTQYPDAVGGLDINTCSNSERSPSVLPSSKTAKNKKSN